MKLTVNVQKQFPLDAIKLHLTTLLEQGEPIPQNEALVHVEELTVGVPG